jgi:pimeloyl-ACP methyl ester carboxylesterase
MSRAIFFGIRSGYRKGMPSVFINKARPASLKAASEADDDYGVTAQPDWREVDWRKHLGEITVRDRRVNYVSLGDGPGPPVLFVHGLDGNWQNWLENLPRTAQERRVVALDLPGHGRSEMPREDISISNYAEVVDEFCQQLGLGQVVCVGNSMGGFIAAELAIRVPERVERLVLAAAAGITVTKLRSAPILTVARVTGAIATRTAARNREVAVRPRLKHYVLAGVFRHPTRLRPELLYEVIQGAGADGFHDALEALLGYDFTDGLPQIRCPTLMIWGEDDLLVPVEDADEFERLIPHSRKLVFEDTGHVPMIERPETFNQQLLEFLAEEHPPTRAEPGADAAAGAKPPAGAEPAPA